MRGFQVLQLIYASYIFGAFTYAYEYSIYEIGAVYDFQSD